MNIVGLIPARGGSKGIPDKNIRPLGGSPLIAWTIKAGRQSRWLTRLIVSTDDQRIAETAKACSVEVPFLRPFELSREDSSSLDVVWHALEWLESEDWRADYVVLLQPTSPFRIAEDIDQAIELALARKADAVVSVCEAASHPYWVKRMQEDGTLHDFVPGKALQRQKLPPAYALNGAIYIYRVAAMREDRSLFFRNPVAYVMPASRSLDIDTPWDFYLAELIARDRNGTE